MTLTMKDARAALDVPADAANCNAVIDGQWRLRAALKLADDYYGDDDAAPDYVARAVAGLQSWIDHHREQEVWRNARRA